MLKMSNEYNTMKRLFYILIPVYNVEKYINNCIESVLNQTYSNFKIIVVDDGSPDNSGKICDDYAKNDERIDVIHKENGGQLSARQSAIKRVLELQKKDVKKESYIMYLDSDDSLKNTALEEINQIISDNNCDMVIYGYDRVSNGKVVRKYNPKNNYEGIVDDKKELYNIVFNNYSYNSLCRKAVKTTLIKDMDYSEYFHISHAEDLLQSLEYYKNTNKTYFLNKALYNYTINENSITQTVNHINYNINFEIREKVMEFLEIEAVFNDEDWKKYRSYCIKLIIDEILTISSFDISAKEKKKYFSEIQSSEYYNCYIKNKAFDKNEVGKKSILYNLFGKKIYFPIITSVKCYRFIKSRKGFNK